MNFSETEIKNCVKEYKNKISELNEIRNRFWDGLRVLRNKFLNEFPGEKYQGNHNWNELYWLISDLYSSKIEEEFTRGQLGFDREDRLICPSCSQRIPKESLIFNVQNLRKAKGLYKSKLLCVVCSIPLSGRQRKYCSVGCQNKAKGRRWREKNPEKKAKANLKYLKDIYPDESS